MFRYLRSLECDAALAEEITQETFLRLHRSLRDGLQVNEVGAWVFRVARNLWIDSRREQQRHWTMPDASSRPGRESEPPPTPEDQLLQRERIRLIDEEIRRLPELERECVNLKLQGLRYHEIAIALDIPMSTAVDCVRRAVRKLRVLFHE